MSVKDFPEFKKQIDEAKTKVKVGAKYYHYKSKENLYTVVDIAMIEETLEPAVIYRPEYVEDNLKFNWIRPISDFLADVEVDGKVQKRFTLVN